MRHITVVFTVMMLHLNAYTTSITVSGSINGTWSYDTVFVRGNINIPEGSQLLISAGTLVMFQSYYTFDVQGGIIAQGAPGDSITFTVSDTAGFSNQQHGRGGWSGIRFRSLAATEDSSTFSYCKFQFGKATEDSLNCYGGALLAHNFNKLKVSNCLFYHNYSFYSGGAIYLQSSDAIIEYCDFIGNTSGNTGVIYGYGGGICALNSAPVVRECRFYYNKSTGVGGACSFDNSDPVIENNIMQFNFSALGGGLGILRSSPGQTISNNLVTSNQALFFGGGICCIRSFPVFSNMTIVDNASAYGGGFYCNDSAAPSMYNSIIWGNTGFGVSVYIWDIYSSPHFYYCNIEGDSTGFEGSGSHIGYTGQYQNNINQVPEFIGTGMFPYQLSPTSPCIDAGTPDELFLNLPLIDLLGEARITNSRIDHGVYEFNSSTQTKFIDLTKPILCFPNPFSQTTTFTVPATDNPIEEVTIYDLNGKLIKKIGRNYHNRSFSWDGTDGLGNKVTHGLYIVKVRTEKALYSGKLVKE